MRVKPTENQLAEKIRGCWLGKAIGGTLGGPHEGKPGPLNLSFYDPVPREMLPNDDLDLQLVWLHQLRATKTRAVTPELLAQAWQRHVGFPFCEYAVCLRNLAYGLTGYRVGSFDNWFADSMGAAIRSEIWACLAAGEPERAAGFAWADAVCDHAGDGVWAEVFFATLQAAAFNHTDPCAFSLLDEALTYIPSDCRVHRAISDTRLWWDQTHDWREVRSRIMARHGHSNFTDVAQNLAFTVLGWLAGKGDFGKSLCLAVNCGQDTDCTGATLGALLGILAPQSIPEFWRKPIGEHIAVSAPIHGIQAPATLAALTEWTIAARTALLEMTPKMGPVVARAPADALDSPIHIPAECAWAKDMDSPRLAAAEKIVLPGHWMMRRRGAFAAPVMLLRFYFELREPLAICAMASGSTPTQAWVDGQALASRPAGFACNYSTVSMPSFHWGGPGQFTSRELVAGRHEFVVAWARPRDGLSTELVFGIGALAGDQWLPWALAQPRKTIA